MTELFKSPKAVQVRKEKIEIDNKIVFQSDDTTCNVVNLTRKSHALCILRKGIRTLASASACSRCWRRCCWTWNWRDLAGSVTVSQNSTSSSLCSSATVWEIISKVWSAQALLGLGVALWSPWILAVGRISVISEQGNITSNGKNKQSPNNGKVANLIF